MRFTAIILILIVRLGMASASFPSSTNFGIVQTITAYEISQSGITRVADVLLLADAVDLNSSDFFTWKTIVGGLGTFQQQHYDVFLNDLKLDANFYDTINLNLRGITLSQIDSVHIGSTPRLILGEVTSQGYIRIFTKRGQMGWDLQGNVNMGNETGDPGPYVYTNLTTPNVDRIGPSAEATLTHGNSEGQEVVTLSVQQHPYTDFALALRTTNYGIHWPGLYHVSSTVMVDRKMAGGWHQFRIALGYAKSLFSMSEALGHEIPSDLISIQSGVAGDIHRSESVRLNYRLNYAFAAMSASPNTFEFQYEWAQEHVSGNLELSVSRRDAGMDFGRRRGFV